MGFMRVFPAGIRPCGVGLACVLASSGAMAGVPFVTDDAATPEAKHVQINLAAAYIRFEGGSVGALPSFQVNYGLTDNVQLSILTPLSFAQTDHVGTNFGVGDTQLGVKYRLIDQDDEGWRPSVAFAPLMTLPSGSAARGLGTGQIQGSIPIIVSKGFEPWLVFGEASYNINPGYDRLNWWFTGIGVTRDLNATWTLGVEVFYTTALGRGLQDGVGFNVGGIYNISDMHHILLAVGRNLTNATANNELSVYLAYQLAF
jgi:hypothetical protein